MSRIAELFPAILSPRPLVRALRQTRVQAWLMVLVLLVHAIVQPRIAMVPRSFIGRETEHEVRLEVAWRGRSAEEEESRPDRRLRRSVSFCAELTARRPTTVGRKALCQQARRCARGADLVNRNGTGGPLRC
jgi:hypothetical protein